MTNKEMFRLAEGLCDIKQNKNEILWALDRTRQHVGRPLNYFLEIGCWSGGSAIMWSQVLAEDGVLIGITLSQNAQVLQSRVSRITNKKFVLINESSEQDSTKDEVLHILSGNRLDGIFVDSDHSAIQTQREIDLYKDLIGSPGVMMFHDICPQKRVDGLLHTGDLWQKMKFDYNYEEKRDNIRPVCGIGILLL